MTHQALVLNSGVTYFSDTFHALPEVVQSLTTRSTASDSLKQDLLKVERSINDNLDTTSESLVQVGGTLTSVAKDFEYTKASARDLRRRVEASVAGLTSRRRDLNALTFRRTQLQHGLRFAEDLEFVLKACQGQLNDWDVVVDADRVAKAQGLFETSLRTRIEGNSKEIAGKIQQRIAERILRVIKILTLRCVETCTGAGPKDMALADGLKRLSEFGALNDAIKQSINKELFKSPPVGLWDENLTTLLSTTTTTSSLNDTSFIARDESQRQHAFLSFPSSNSAQRTVSAVQKLINWGDFMMDRASHASNSIKQLKIASTDSDEFLKSIGSAIAVLESNENQVWKWIQECIERELRPRFDAFGVLSEKRVADERPRHYKRKPAGFNAAKVSSMSETMKSHRDRGEEGSPYHLAFVCETLVNFAQKYDSARPGTAGRLKQFLRETAETSLRSVINRDAAALFDLKPDSKPSEFYRSGCRLESVLIEMDESVLRRIKICDAKVLLSDVCKPFLHACKKRINSAVDSGCSAWVAGGGVRLVTSLRKDPLFLAIEATRRGDPAPNRSALLEATYDFTKQFEQLHSFKNDKQTAPCSDLSTLVALHAILHRVADHVASDERDDFVSLGDYALFSAKADVGLGVESYLGRIRDVAVQKMDARGAVSIGSSATTPTDAFLRVAESIRRARAAVECWTESPSVFDFLFLPVALSSGKIASRAVLNPLLSADISRESLFAVKSAFACALVGSSVDPFADLQIFDVVALAFRLVNARRAKSSDTSDQDALLERDENIAALKSRLTKELPSTMTSRAFTMEEINAL